MLSARYQPICKARDLVYVAGPPGSEVGQGGFRKTLFLLGGTEGSNPTLGSIGLSKNARDSAILGE